MEEPEWNLQMLEGLARQFGRASVECMVKPRPTWVTVAREGQFVADDKMEYTWGWLNDAAIHRSDREGIAEMFKVWEEDGLLKIPSVSQARTS